MNTQIDLHMHSYFSDDGQFNEEELIDIAKKNKLKIIAIADHNSVEAIEKAHVLADENNIKLIPAIEIDCTYNDINLHVLAYGIDYKNPKFNQLGQDIIKQELETSYEKIKLVNQLGFEITKEQLDKLSTNGVYTGEMFAEVLLEDQRYLDHQLLIPYRKNGNRSDNPFVNFYWDYFAQGKACYTKVIYPSLEEILNLIHSNGGISVLAHPGNNLKGKFELLDEMVSLGLKGVEAFSSYHSNETNLYFYDKAKELKLLMTCGSDFHGKTKPSIKMGESGCLVDYESMKEQLESYQLI